jgi:hypothetical protein
MHQTVLGSGIVCLHFPSVDHIFTEQSSPPEAISPVASVLTANTNPVWPLKVYNKDPSVLHNLTVSSLEHEVNPIPGTSQISLIISSCAFGNSFWSWPLNQSLRVLSWEPVITIPFGRLKTETACWWPSKTWRHLPVWVSHTLAVPSQEPVTSSSGID